MFWNYDYVHVKVRIHGEILHVMPKLHRLSTPDIVARYVAVVEFSPAFATFRVFTIAYLPSQLRKFQCSANQISHSHKSHGWLKCHSSHVSRKLKSSFRQAQKETHTPVFFFDQWRNQWNEKVKVFFIHSYVLLVRTEGSSVANSRTILWIAHIPCLLAIQPRTQTRRFLLFMRPFSSPFKSI